MKTQKVRVFRRDNSTKRWISPVFVRAEAQGGVRFHRRGTGGDGPFFRRPPGVPQSWRGKGFICAAQSSIVQRR